MKTDDVLIIGGGPAGSSCAKELAKRGIGVTVIEKDSFCGEKNVCGGVLNAAAVEKYDLQYATEGKLSKARMYCENNFIEVPQERYTFRRSYFDRKLSEAAIEEGANVLHDQLMIDFSVKADGVKIKIKNATTGEEKFIDGSLIVGADGFASKVRSKLNGNSRMDWLACVQYQIPYTAVEDIDTDVAYFIFNEIYKSGYGWIFPKKEGLTVGIGSPCPIDFDIKKELDNLALPLMKKNANHKKFYESSLIPAKIADKLVGNRALLIGDAAGLVKPIGGGGIEYAIESGIEAAKTIEKALLERKSLNENTLSRYLQNIDHIAKKIEKEGKLLEFLEREGFAKLFNNLMAKKKFQTLSLLFTGNKNCLLGTFKESPLLVLKYLRHGLGAAGHD